MEHGEVVTALLGQIEAEQARLRAIVPGKDEAALATRPAGGGWFTIETVRHLLFAEQLHLGRLVPGDRTWSPAGYTPATMREARKAGPGPGTQPPLAEVLAAWRDVHEEVVRGLGDRASGDVVVALTRDLKHLRRHVTGIERLLRQLP